MECQLVGTQGLRLGPGSPPEGIPERWPARAYSIGLSPFCHRASVVLSNRAGANSTGSIVATTSAGFLAVTSMPSGAPSIRLQEYSGRSGRPVPRGYGPNPHQSWRTPRAPTHFGVRYLPGDRNLIARYTVHPGCILPTQRTLKLSSSPSGGYVDAVGGSLH